MEKKSIQWMAFAGAVIICLASAPSAYAGCGHPVLPGLIQHQAAHAWATEAVRALDGRVETDAGHESIVGLWLETVLMAGQPIYQAFESFSSDGTEILNDNGAPQAGNVCLGVWASTGRNTLKVNHPAWNYDNNGNVIGTVTIRSQIAIDGGGKTYKGTVTIDVYDLNGNQVAPTTIAQITGKRITVN